VLQLFRTVTGVSVQNCIETFMLGEQKPLVKQPGDRPGDFLRISDSAKYQRPEGMLLNQANT